jgi:signal transduction histidine kinase
MDGMTTSGSQTAPPPRRRRWVWLGLLLPLLAVETLGLGLGSVPVLRLAALLILLTAILALVAPKVTAKLVPFAILAYGGYGFYLAHYTQGTGAGPLVYGVVRAGTNDNTGWLVPEAFVFIVAGVLLLALTDAPGGRAVRQAFWQLRGTHDQPRTVPPLLLLPVIFLWEELLCSNPWLPLFSAGPASQVVALAILAIGVAMVARRPRAAAVTAVAGIVIFGLVGVLGILHSLLNWNVLSVAPQAIFYGALTVHSFTMPAMVARFMPWLVQDSLAVQLLALAQGLALVMFGISLVPRMLPRDGDAELARQARVLTQRVTRLTETRSDATEVAVAELRRIERDLHDGAQARLVAVGMSLRAAEELMRANPEAARALVAEARETSSRALDDLRGLVRGIYPPVLADRGLADAVRALALDAPLTVDTDITLADELPMPVAAAVYFAIAEALTNAVRHSGADTVQIGIGLCADMLRVTVVDDGCGGADPSAGTGLSGVERRLATFDGILAITSPVGGPTIVVIEVPCTPTYAPRWPQAGGWTEVVRSSWQTRTLI